MGKKKKLEDYEDKDNGLICITKKIKTLDGSSIARQIINCEFCAVEISPNDRDQNVLNGYNLSKIFIEWKYVISTVVIQ